MKSFDIKPRVNKKNGQIKLELPRKQIPKDQLKKLLYGGKIRISIRDLKL